MKWSDYSKLSKAERKAVPFKEVPAGQKIAAFTLLASVIVLIVIMFTNTSVSDDTIKSNASFVAQKFVKSQLKSPSTADFITSEERVGLNNNNVANVEGSVDSENGFGAKVRTTYSVTVQWKDDPSKIEEYSIVDFKIK